MLSQMSLWRSVTRVLLLGLILPLSNALPARAALDENGWFEAPADEAVADSGGVEAVSAPAPQSMESVPPSPLLEPDAAPAPEPAQLDRDPRALSDFRPTLDPYGSWVNHPTYGTIWVPRRDVVGPDFAPYVSAGNWALDDYGNWVWMSDYPFGRVVFHYGRWVWVGGSGWAWVPGFRYAPAWVSWRVPTGSYAYVGWAPLAPDYVWFNGVAVSFGMGLPVSWVFCPSVNVFHRHVHRYVVRDRVVVARAAANTRRYAAPHAYSVRGRAVVRHSGPSLASARVPAHAVPRERVRQANRRFTMPSGPQRRSIAPTRPSGPARAVPGRTYQAPQRVQPRQSAPVQRVQPPRQHSQPVPRQVAPRSEPRQVAPRSAVPRSEPRQVAPRPEPRRYQMSPPQLRVPRSQPSGPRHVEPIRSVPRMAPSGGGGRRHR